MHASNINKIVEKQIFITSNVQEHEKGHLTSLKLAQLLLNHCLVTSKSYSYLFQFYILT